jgi:transketolase
LEQIRLDVLYHRANVNVVAIGGGFSYGSLGVSHHATEDIAIMRALPGIRVYAPCDEVETRCITEEMVAHPGPSYLRLDKSKLLAHDAAAYQRGKLRVIRPGKDVLIFGYGGILAEALAASNQLSTLGIECGVVSVSSLKPFDRDSFASLSSGVEAIVTLEEHVSIGGLSSIVADVLIETGHRPRRILRLSLADQFTAIVGSQDYLRSRCGLDASAISKRIRELLGSS